MLNKGFIRTGAYGLIVQEGKILLVRQRSGPYLDLWHLPGGGVEFAETPVQALHRELLEETAHRTEDPTLLTILSDCGTYAKEPEGYRYHHIGVIYRLAHLIPTDHSPEDESRWFPIHKLDLAQTTPFVRQLKEQKFF